jgi:hypothetical protein
MELSRRRSAAEILMLKNFIEKEQILQSRKKG